MKKTIADEDKACRWLAERANGIMVRQLHDYWGDHPGSAGCEVHTPDDAYAAYVDLDRQGAEVTVLDLDGARVPGMEQELNKKLYDYATIERIAGEWLRREDEEARADRRQEEGYWHVQRL